MKKFLTLFFCTVIPSIMLAQLTVLPNGNVYIKDGSLNCNANLIVSDAPYLGFVSDNVNGNIGVRSQGYTSTANNSSIGLIGEGYIQNSNNASIGVWGEGYGAPCKNFGIVGMLDIGNNGAGVYATTEGNLNYFSNGAYAGYFVGPTYVDGNFTASSIYNLSDIRLKENVTSFKILPKELSPLTKLQKLDVIAYNLKRPNTMIASDKLHFGIYAQALQDIYPNLVQEGQDGYLTINYIELVPLLLHCIQELQQEIEDLKNKENRHIQSSVDNKKTSISQNVLYQSVVNPYSKETTIKFRLADNVQEASIYIFNTNGTLLKKFPISTGEDRISFNNHELGTGLFLCSMVVNGKETDTKKIIISE